MPALPAQGQLLPQGPNASGRTSSLIVFCRLHCMTQRDTAGSAPSPPAGSMHTNQSTLSTLQPSCNGPAVHAAGPCSEREVSRCRRCDHFPFTVCRKDRTSQLLWGCSRPALPLKGRRHCFGFGFFGSSAREVYHICTDGVHASAEPPGGQTKPALCCHPV